MDLQTLYTKINQIILSLDLDSFWPGFKPLKFALYNENECYFDGRYIDKTDEFCANTSILFNGEQIAIWMVQQETDLCVLTSKIVHEMFHGYQRKMGWDCWPNELDALYHYQYDAENLALKLRENALLLELLDRIEEPDLAVLNELIALRKQRSLMFPYEFDYESKVEEIEGTANYVEWQVLRDLDVKKGDELTRHMRSVLTKPEFLFPIRISCYYTGALMVIALRSANQYSFFPAERPSIFTVLKDAAPSDGNFLSQDTFRAGASMAVDSFNDETAGIIHSALDGGNVVLRGPLELTGVNYYNARCYDGFITTTYFLMYRDGREDKFLQGNFVIKMRDEKTIDTVYAWNIKE